MLCGYSRCLDFGEIVVFVCLFCLCQLLVCDRYYLLLQLVDMYYLSGLVYGCWRFGYIFLNFVRSCGIWGEIIFLVGNISLFCGPYGVERNGNIHWMQRMRSYWIRLNGRK